VHLVEQFQEFGVDAFVTDRFGGVSDPPYDSLNLGSHVGDRVEHVAENRRRVASAIGVAPEQLVIVRQVHGNQVLDASISLEAREADGLFTSSPDLALAVLVADCVPVLIVDESCAAFAVVHAGWRGLSSQVLSNAVARFNDPRSLHAFVGPSISFEGYQVGPEVAEKFADVEGAVAPDEGDRSRLDLRLVATRHLLQHGLSDSNIIVSTQSTDGGGLFYSDRAARPCGRFALVAKRRVVA
jgi:hypothetical protein